MDRTQLYVPTIDYRFAGTASDMQRLDVLLGDALRLTEFPPPQNDAAVLNIACGRADESGVLWKHFLPACGGGAYLGCDLRAPEIAEAKKRWPCPQDRHWQVEFRVADASSAHALPGAGSMDVIFIRHQNYWDAPQVWDLIYRNALRCLKDNGRLVITSYFEREHELALAALRSLGAVLLANLPHPAARALPDAPGKSVDRRLAVLMRDR